MITGQEWTYLLTFLFLVLFLGAALVLKNGFKLFRKHLVPTSMIAGFIGLLLGSEGIGLLHLNSYVLEKFIYHSMAIGFIALALKNRSNEKSNAIRNTGFLIVNTYAVQGIIGFSLSLFLVYFFYPHLFPNFGLLLPLGFAQGPGQAHNTGTAWSIYENFKMGGNIGLSIATIGSLWALIGGVPFMNILVKRSGRKKTDFNPIDLKNIDTDTETQHTIRMPKTAYIDELSVQIILIACVYLLTYGFLFSFQSIIAPLGMFGQTLSRLFWGFNFLFGTLIALLFKTVLNKLRTKNIVKINYTDNYLLQRISSTAFDLMITASIAAISINALKDYLVPVLIITTVGGVSMMFYTTWYCKRVYKENVIEHIVALYGMFTGTITTGVALLKELDPKSETPVTEHLILGSGVAAIIGIPLMLILAVPDMGYRLNQPIYYAIALVLLALYALVMNIGLFRGKNHKTKGK